MQIYANWLLVLTYNSEIFFRKFTIFWPFNGYFDKNHHFRAQHINFQWPNVLISCLESHFRPKFSMICRFILTIYPVFAETYDFSICKMNLSKKCFQTIIKIITFNLRKFHLKSVPILEHASSPFLSARYSRALSCISGYLQDANR